MNKHDAIIYGINLMKTWQVEDELYFDGYPRYRKAVRYSNKKIDTEIWSGELDFPPVSVGDKIYITESDIYVTIDEIIRTTYNEYIYRTSHVIEEYVSSTLEEDRLSAIEEWMQEEYSTYSKFEELKYFKPKVNIVYEEPITEKESRTRRMWSSLSKYFKK